MIRTTRGTASVGGMLTKEEFGRRLRDAALEKGWNASELARQATRYSSSEIGRDSIAGYFRGRSFPRAPHLSAIAQALGKKPDELLPNTLHSDAERDTSLDMRAVPGHPDKVRLQINQILPFDTAMKVLAILQALSK